jgi:hypothetical protein
MKPLFILSLILLLVGPVAAEDYLPLETGNFWNYVAEDGTMEMQVVGEQVPIFQGNAFPIIHSGTAGNEGLTNFWTSETDGGVLLWGFSLPSWGYIYQPPVRVVDAPLYVGKTWTETFDIYSLPDTAFVETIEMTFSVYEDPELTVPAGEYPTFGIGGAEPGFATPLGKRFTLAGKSLTGLSRNVTEWYSQGVGVVQMDYSQLLQLETYTDHPVVVEGSSWGAVKALYRGE